MTHSAEFKPEICDNCAVDRQIKMELVATAERQIKQDLAAVARANQHVFPATFPIAPKDSTSFLNNGGLRLPTGQKEDKSAGASRSCAESQTMVPGTQECENQLRLA